MLSKSFKKIVPYRPFHRAIDETFEDSGKVLAVSVFEFHWSTVLPAHAYKMVITAACVQIELLSISVRR